LKELKCDPRESSLEVSESGMDISMEKEFIEFFGRVRLIEN
jgi:hypothetical protein